MTLRTTSGGQGRPGHDPRPQVVKTHILVSHGFQDGEKHGGNPVDGGAFFLHQGM